MKRSLTSAACLLVILCHGVVGQEPKKVQEPEYLGTFFLVDSDTGNLIPLERLPGETKVKVKAMGFGGGEGSIEFKGENLPCDSKKDKSWSSSCWFRRSKLILRP